MRFSACLLACFYVALFSPARSAEVQVAVAANFAGPMQQIASQFEQRSGHTVLLSFASSGKLLTQITQSAPFDLFLAADQAMPARLVEQHLAVAGSQFTYATGKLVLWSATPGLVDAQARVLLQGRFQHLAIASPRQAPYGAAALQTLNALKLSYADKIVQGESIGQAYALVASGNAELGLVALSQVWKDNKITSGSAWIVPSTLYSPLRQDAVLLIHGQNNAAAKALLGYLKTDQVQQLIHSWGYTN